MLQIKRFLNKIFRRIVLYNNSLVDEQCTIGDYTYIGRSVSIAKSSIGRYSIVGNNVSIGQGERDYSQIALSGRLYDFDIYQKYTQRECVIGNDVLIGVDTIIMRGVCIGDGVIIGANSVVTHNIPDYAIAVGSPAKVIKYRFSKKKAEAIKATAWWNMEIDKARKIVAELEELEL